MELVTNASYFFIPFSYGCPFSRFYQSLLHSESWEIIHDEIKYMLRHVADKLDSTKEESCLCFHFALKEDARKQLQMVSPREVCRIEGKFSGKKEIFPFRLTGVQLYCFSTQIGVMAFRLEFDRDDPIWLATAPILCQKGFPYPCDIQFRRNGTGAGRHGYSHGLGVVFAACHLARYRMAAVFLCSAGNRAGQCPHLCGSTAPGWPAERRL